MMLQGRCICQVSRLLLHYTTSHSRFFNSTPVVCDIKFRLRNKLSVNHNADGVLTDSPDFTYLDSRKPTPLNKGQMARIIRQKELAETVLKLNEEIQFALNTEKQNLLDDKEATQKIIKAKLKPKGDSSKVKLRS